MTAYAAAYVVALVVLTLAWLIWAFPGNDDPDWRVQ